MIGFLPGVPHVALPPELVLLIFLPPILMGAAYFTSLRDLRQNLLAIGLLAVGLVAATTLAVGWVAQTLAPGIGWAGAFVLGAIVSPTDPAAATAIMAMGGLVWGAGGLALASAAGLAAGHLLAQGLFERRLGGYTGDCLGAVQQLSEVGLYLGVIAWL